MSRLNRLRIVALSLLAFLFAGVASAHAHVHLCFDGLESPAMLHAKADEPHGIHGDEAGEHQDVDVDVSSQAVVKTLKLDLSDAAFIAGWSLAVPVALPGHGAFPSRTEPLPAPPRFWRPPLRAPPC